LKLGAGKVDWKGGESTALGLEWSGVMLRGAEILFSGRVQGVGFRYTAKQLSRRFSVWGTIENLPDRRVRLLIEGEFSEIEGFLEALLENNHGTVVDTERIGKPYRGEFSGFEIIG
jgi:acylphosphatase